MNERAELGTDTELLALVAKVQGFDFVSATMPENSALVRALKLIAEDTTRKWDEVRQLKEQLNAKLEAASVAAELAGVVKSIANTPAAPRRRWFNLER